MFLPYRQPNHFVDFENRACSVDESVGDQGPGAGRDISILFFVLGVGFPLYPVIFHIITMFLQRIRIIVGDARFEPGTSAPEPWCATIEPPHLHRHNFFFVAENINIYLPFQIFQRCRRF